MLNMPEKLKYQKLMKSIIQPRVFIVIFTCLIFVLVVIGHTLTVPIRGEISFGSNYATQDGSRYAKMAYKFHGYSENKACEIVEKKWTEWLGAEYILCAEPRNTSADEYYASRLLYPYVVSLLIPISGINSVVWVVILFFIILFVIQILLLNSFKLNSIAAILSIITLYSSKHFIDLSLSTAATDLFLSIFVLILFYALYGNLTSKNLAIVTVLISILSTINKQTQLFWITFSLVLIIQGVIYNLTYKKKFYLVAIIMIPTQITSLFITEKIWQSISVVQSNKLGLIFTEVTNFQDLARILINITVNDIATITTKDLSTFFIFFSYVALLYNFRKTPSTSNEYQLISMSAAYITSCLIACIVNVVVIGVGNLYLRMYLPFLSLSFICLALMFQKVLGPRNLKKFASGRN
jgi:hypothetical protein